MSNFGNQPNPYPNPNPSVPGYAPGYPPQPWPANTQPPLWAPWYGIGFWQAVVRFFRKTFIFHGRASRGEYWWVYLFTLLLTVAVCVIAGGIGSLMGYSFGTGPDAIDSPLSDVIDNAAIVAELVLWLPNLSLSVRRLHDENRRGWWMLLPILLQIATVIVTVAVFFAMAMTSDDSEGALAQTVIVTLLVFCGMSLLSMLVSIILMVGPSKPAGARFDRPYDARVHRAGQRSRNKLDRLQGRV